MNAGPAGRAACCLQSGRWDPWWLGHTLPFSIAIPNGGSCRHSAGLSTARCSTHPRSAAAAATMLVYFFQFGWKFPPEIVLVIFYPNSHNSCFSFGFQGTPFSCSFLCPRFQTILSPCSLLSVPCLPSGSVLPLPTPSSCPLVALQSNREGWKPRGALCPHLVSPQLHRMASGQTKCTCGLFG